MILIFNFSESNEFVYGFECQENFRLKGESVIRCKEGIWDNPIPECQLKASTRIRRHFLVVLSIVVLIGVVIICWMKYHKNKDVYRKEDDSFEKVMNNFNVIKYNIF